MASSYHAISELAAIAASVGPADGRAEVKCPCAVLGCAVGGRSYHGEILRGKGWPCVFNHGGRYRAGAKEAEKARVTCGKWAEKWAGDLAGKWQARLKKRPPHQQSSHWRAYKASAGFISVPFVVFFTWFIILILLLILLLLLFLYFCTYICVFLSAYSCIQCYNEEGESLWRETCVGSRVGLLWLW